MIKKQAGQGISSKNKEKIANGSNNNSQIIMLLKFYI